MFFTFNFIFCILKDVFWDVGKLGSWEVPVKNGKKLMFFRGVLTLFLFIFISLQLKY